MPAQSQTGFPGGIGWPRGAGQRGAHRRVPDHTLPGVPIRAQIGAGQRTAIVFGHQEGGIAPAHQKVMVIAPRFDQGMGQAQRQRAVAAGMRP